MFEKEIHRRVFLQFVGIVLCAVFLCCPWLLMAQQARILSIATGGTGGVWYVMGGGMANILTKNLPNIKVTAEVTSAGIDNGKLLDANKVDLALMVADNAYEAYMGIEKFNKKIPIRTLLALYPNIFQAVTLEGSGINSVKDFRGKRVSLGAPMSGTELKGIKVLEAYGLDYKRDVKNDRLSVSESVSALKDGKIEAFYWVGGIPTGAILDLAATPGIKIKILDLTDGLPKLKEKYGPFYFSSLIPKGTYPGIDYDVHTIALGSMLCCLEKMDENLAYQITKTILENEKELSLVHKEAKAINLRNAVIGSSIPYHPGAIRYYKEKGVTIQQ